MSRELIVKKCMKCGTEVKILKNNASNMNNIQCCGDEMKTLIPNSVDAAVEKHVPTYEVENGKIIVSVNHVMEKEHYIEWIAMITEDKECIHYFKPGMEARVSFPYLPNAILYAYCNQHGLWKTEVN